MNKRHFGVFSLLLMWPIFSSSKVFHNNYGGSHQQRETTYYFHLGKLERFWKPFEFKLDEANFQCVPFIKQKAFYYVSRISNLTLGTSWTSMKIKNSFVFTAFINQSWNFLNNLETHKIVLFCPLSNFKEFGNLGRVWLPLIGFQPLPYLIWPFNMIAHDALWKAKMKIWLKF